MNIPLVDVDEYNQVVKDACKNHSIPAAPATHTTSFAAIAKKVDGNVIKESPVPQKLGEHQECISNVLGGEKYWAMVHKPIPIPMAFKSKKHARRWKLNGRNWKIQTHRENKLGTLISLEEERMLQKMP